MWETAQDSQVAALQSRVETLESRLEQLVAMLGLMRPASAILTHNGADEARQRAIVDLINDMSARLNAGSSASYAEFEERIADLVPGRRGDRKFLGLLIHALKLEHPDSKPVLDYLTQTMALFRA